MHERPICQLSIDRSSSAATSISITNPSINMLEASGNGRSPLVQAEVALRAFSFGPFRIVPHARLVERDGLPMPLGSRAFDLLCVLVSRPGEVVSKGELMAKVWPDLTVEESNLRFHIAQLRRALSDGQGGERYVTNVPRRGYCFVAPVGCAASPYIQHPTVEEIYHANGSTLVPAGGKCERREGPSAIADLGGICAHL